MVPVCGQPFICNTLSIIQQCLQSKTILLGLLNKQLTKNVFSMTWFIPNRGLGLSCFSNVRKITCLRNAILNVFMHKKHTCTCAYQKDGKHLLMSDWNNCVFYWRDIIFQKNLAVRILAEVSAYWRSKIETSTKNSLNYEVLANYANN